MWPFLGMGFRRAIESDRASGVAGSDDEEEEEEAKQGRDSESGPPSWTATTAPVSSASVFILLSQIFLDVVAPWSRVWIVCVCVCYLRDLSDVSLVTPRRVDVESCRHA